MNSAEMVLVKGGEVEIGTNRLVFSYDNERPPHRVGIDPFLIDRVPVTIGAFIEFIEAGSYERKELWSEDGLRWLRDTQAALPRYWRRDGDGFSIRSFANWLPADPGKPVCHVTWFEADAYARFAGKRLPSEQEWETAASCDSATLTKCTYPWGESVPEDSHANLGQVAFATAPAGSYPEGASPCGALQMIGDVWEWTASGFDAYPGFKAYPYREYSQEFFGGSFRVLRGGSWATAGNAVNNTFRNWDHRERSQIFSGFRCARNVDGRSETET